MTIPHSSYRYVEFITMTSIGSLAIYDYKVQQKQIKVFRKFTNVAGQHIA